jgi:hypothetical protein
MSVIRDENQTICIDAAFLKHLKFSIKLINIYNAPITNDRPYSKEYTGWNVMCYKLGAFVVYGMTSITSAIIANTMCILARP